MSPTWTPVCAVTAADPSLNLGAGPRRGRCRAALAIGVIAALDQLHIAQNVVNAILYAVLAGIAVVAVGGGGIRTMSQRWEDAAARYEAGKPRIAAAARSAPSLTDQGRQAMPDDVGSGRTERARTFPVGLCQATIREDAHVPGREHT